MRGEREALAQSRILFVRCVSCLAVVTASISRVCEHAWRASRIMSPLGSPEGGIEALHLAVARMVFPVKKNLTLFHFAGFWGPAHCSFYKHHKIASYWFSTCQVKSKLSVMSNDCWSKCWFLAKNLADFLSLSYINVAKMKTWCKENSCYTRLA